jgi:hypothetical protein
VEDKLLGHLLKANDPDTAREVESWLAAEPAAVGDLETLRRALAPLELAREEFDPPDDLWIRALSRVAEHIVATEGPLTSSADNRTDDLIRRAALLASSPPTPVSLRPAPTSEALSIAPRRRNVVAIVGLSAAVLALIFPAVVHVRRHAQETACVDTMRQFYKAASDYSDYNDGHFPQVEEGKIAATAADTLKNTGYLPPDMRFTCPAGRPGDAVPVALANYAYSLGFRDESGQLWGLDRTPQNEALPILADAPLRQGGLAIPGNHRHGQNVLFTGGNVRFCTTSLVGFNGDDIFVNAEGKVGAGLGPLDTSLGRPDERP